MMSFGALRNAARRLFGGIFGSARPSVTPAEPALPTPASKGSQTQPVGADVDDKARVDFLIRAADLHLRRAIALADTEWKVTVLFWGTLLTSGASFISFSSNSAPPMAVYIAHNDWIFLGAYLFGASVFLFGFSVNQSASIVEERRQYQFCQNEAAALANLSVRAKTGGRLPQVDEDPGMNAFRRNKVWGMKVMSSFFFISGIWVSVQVLAHGKIGLESGTVRKGEDLSLSCAFFECRDDNRWDWQDWPEWGTLLWLIAFLVVTKLVWDAQRGGER